jgi:membrane protein
VLSIAAGVTFFALLAMFPAVGALVSVYGLFSDPSTIHAQLDEVSLFLPDGAIEIVGDQLRRVASGGKSTGCNVPRQLTLSLWSANAGMKALFDALYIVYGATERRGLLKLNVVSLAFTVGALLILLLAIAAMVVVPLALEYVGLETIGGWAATLGGRWPALFAMILVGLALIYRFGPDREHAQWHWITWGSALAALLWIVASILLSWYAANFGAYNKTYGSLGAAISFMTWIWISPSSSGRSGS